MNIEDFESPGDGVLRSFCFSFSLRRSSSYRLGGSGGGRSKEREVKRKAESRFRVCRNVERRSWKLRARTKVIIRTMARTMKKEARVARVGRTLMLYRD